MAERPPEFEMPAFLFRKEMRVTERKRYCAKISVPALFSHFLKGWKMADEKKVEKKPQANPRLAAAAPRKYKTSGRESNDFRGIVRLAGRDIDGHFLVKDALRRLKGIGHNLAHSIMKLIEKELGIKPDELVGNLSEEQLARIETLVKTPGAHGALRFMLNRQKDVETGKDLHLVSTDLTFAIKQDFDRERETRSWRGWRRSIGQKVRGQRTRNTGRTGMTVGVLKKAIKAQKAAAAASAQEGGKKEEKK